MRTREMDQRNIDQRQDDVRDTRKLEKTKKKKPKTGKTESLAFSVTTGSVEGKRAEGEEDAD